MSLGSGKWFLGSNSISRATSEKKRKKKKINTIKIKMSVLQNEIGTDRP